MRTERSSGEKPSGLGEYARPRRNRCVGSAEGQGYREAWECDDGRCPPTV